MLRWRGGMGWRGRGRWLQLECNTRLEVVMEEERR